MVGLNAMTGWMMGASAMVRAMWEGMHARNWDKVRGLLADDLVMDWPQTREVIRGADAFVELNRTYPGQWSIRVEEVVGTATRAAARVTITNGTARFLASGFYTVRDGRIVRGVETFADPGDPPYDRSHLADRVVEPA